MIIICETTGRLISKYLKCDLFTTMTTTTGVVLLILWTLSASVSSSSFRKCCPPGEVFSGVSKVDCVPAPERATELYIVDFDTGNATYDGFPICEKPQDISTTPLLELKPSDFLQVRDGLAVSSLTLGRS